MAPAEDPWYRIENPEQLDTPVLVVYPDRVQANIDLAVKMVGGDPGRLRPHVKTHKSPDVIRLMQAAGIGKFKCATIAEAEMLAMTGAADVLLAYQPIGPKAARLAALIHAYPQTAFSCLIDNEAAAASMGQVFSAAGLIVPVYLDLNLGMNRTGIQPAEAALELYRQATEIPAISPIGLHAYDGHIRDTDFSRREQKCNAAFAAVVALQRALSVTNPIPLIVAGGSPTFSIHCGRDGIECSPGTFIYWDQGYSDGCPEQAFLPAALVLTRVISLPEPNRICLDLGHKSIAPENELSRRVRFLDAPGLTAIGQSEEHLVMETAPGHSHQVGDLFYGLPVHICPTVALYERAITIGKGQLTGEWRNEARDRKIRI